MEWMPPMGDYRSVPLRPRWDGPGWGTVMLAGVVVAGMGWAVLAERGEEEKGAPAVVGAAPAGNGTAVAGLGGAEEGRESEPLGGPEPAGGPETSGEPEEQRVPVAWVRKTGEGARTAAEEAPRRGGAAPGRAAEPAKRVGRRHGAEPARRARPARRSKARAARWVRAGEHRRGFRAGPSAGPRNVRPRPVENALSEFVGWECERQAAGSGLFCAAVLEQIFAAGQAHGGR
ncbi:hypothetical protein GCM10009550_70600 [Actinocorallia libanotica]|uniref:Uncharacterized protein n=1 Tax=Actinocorallia libanotica TaxID=46162 RepID=A0ABN1RXH2_9ACTN